jgi:hypothetical protein
MTVRRPFPTPSAAWGVRTWWEDDGKGGGTVVSQQAVDAILDRNKAMATHNDGYTPSRDMRRVASVPVTMLYKWLAEEGYDPRTGGFRDAMAGIVKKKLNDLDYAYLRTAPGRL